MVTRAWPARDTMSGMTEIRKHVLVWVAAEFLQSEGMLHILEEAGLFPVPETRIDKFFESLEQIGGFAMTGSLIDVHHGAGIWIAPEKSPELQFMIPWGVVRAVLTAEEPRAATIMGLRRDLAKRRTEAAQNPPVKPPSGPVPSTGS